MEFMVNTRAGGKIFTIKEGLKFEEMVHEDFGINRLGNELELSYALPCNPFSKSVSLVEFLPKMKRYYCDVCVCPVRLNQGHVIRALKFMWPSLLTSPESVVALAREKAAELEDFSPSEESGKRKRREDDQEEASRGAARARKFLKEFAEMPLDKVELKDSLNRLHELKQELEKDAVDCH